MFPLHSRISHQICDFLFFILEFDLMILDLAKGALSVSEAMNLDFTRRESIRRVLPLYISSFFFITSCDSHICAFVPRETAEQYLLYCWQTTASDTDTPLPFVHLKHRLLQEKEPVWIPPSWSVCRPHQEHNIPTEKVISCSDPAPAPFITGPQQQKHDAVTGPSSPSGTW